MMIHSFDVFDTIIGRKTILPEGVFYIMQERMMASRFFREYVGVSRISRFVELRKAAERMSAVSSGFSLAHIDHIYDILFRLMGSVSSEVIEKIKSLEIDTECEMAFGINENIDKIFELIQENERVILISDMYFSSNDIRKILLSVDRRLGTLPMYVSCEWGCTKGDGSLFFKVRDKEGVCFTDWIHVGDNDIADSIVPSHLGIKTKKFTLVKKLEIEEYGVNEYKKNTNMSCLGIGFARTLRYQKGWNIYESIGGYVGGAIIFSYIMWMVEEALQNNIEKLLFIARDGYVLKLVADIIIRERGYRISTEYIYGSRMAWREHEAEKRANAVAYVRSVLEDKKCAFVDLQSSGISLDSLLKDINEIQSMPCFVYCLARYTELEKVHPIVFSESNTNISVEVFCRAPHGVTKGYVVRNGEINPIVGEWNVDWEESHQNEFTNGLIDYTLGMIELLNKLGIIGDWRDYNVSVCKYIDSMRNTKLNDFIGDIIHDDGEKHSEGRYAPILTREDMEQIELFGEEIFKNRFYVGTNYELSVKRTNNLYNDTEINQFERYNSLITLEKKKRILIYTAGKQGKKYYKILKKLKDIEVVGWTDIRASEYKKDGLPVISIKESVNISRDYVLVPMSKNGSVFNNIVTFLRSVGFEDEIMSSEDICEHIYNVVLGKEIS